MKILTLILLIIYSCQIQAQETSGQRFKRFNHILFSDDFKNDTVGKIPSRWLFAKGNNGDYNATLGILEHDYSKKLAGKMRITDDSKRAITYYGDYVSTIFPPFNQILCPNDSFTLECDFMINDLASQAYIVFSGKNMEFLIWNTIKGDGKINAEEDDITGVPFEKNGSPFRNNLTYSLHSPDAPWHHLAISYRKNNLSYFIDGSYLGMLEGVFIKHFNFFVSARLHSKSSRISYTNFLVTAGPCFRFTNIITNSKLVTYAIHFDKDQYLIKPESDNYLDELVQWLNDNPSINLEIDGHTDNNGTPEYNRNLSTKRADEIKKRLNTLGISNSRLTTKGYGDSMPLKSNDTEEGKAANRRVEFLKK